MPLRFTIRDLLWLTALVAMGVAWWVDHRRIQSRNTEIEQKLEVIQDGIYLLERHPERPGGSITFQLKK